MAVWLFLYLLVNADRKTGSLFRKIETISDDMGISRDTIMRWLVILRRGGYIATQSNGRCLNIQINKWRRPDGGSDQPQKSVASNRRGWKTFVVNKPLDGKIDLKVSGKKNAVSNPIDISINKDSYKDDIDKGISLKPNLNSFKDFKPSDKEDLLAVDLADAFNDRDNLPLYLSYANRYPEQLLRTVMGEVKEIPLKKIKKSRGALFNHLVQKYAKQTDNNSRD